MNEEQICFLIGIGCMVLVSLCGFYKLWYQPAKEMGLLERRKRK